MNKDISKKFMNAMFRQISNVSYDLASGQTGIKTDDGLITISGDTIEQNPLDFFSMEIPAFAMITPLNEVKRGDILVEGDKATAFIQEVTSNEIAVINTSGQLTSYVPKKIQFMGVKDGIQVVKSFTSMFGGSEQNGGMGSMLPLMLMMGSDGNNKKDMLLPLMLMQGGGQSANSMLPLMLMMGGDFKNPFQ